ncbi:MAG: glycosyltransferase [Candidatus Micrarchaeia archaeon]
MNFSKESIKTVQIPNLTVIIPAYNEENRISSVLDELSDYISSNNMPWNIIVSIDGNDNTENIVKNYIAKYNFISYNKKEGRNGKGQSIKRAVPFAIGEFTMLMDADGSIKLSEIIKNLHYLSNYDAIIFNRYSDPENNIPILRRIASRGFNIIVRSFLGIKIRDTQCGYKIIRTNIMKEVFEKIAISNAFFDVSLIYYIIKMKGKMIEVSIKYKYDPNSKFSLVSLILGQGISLIAFRVRHSRFYKYVPKIIEELYYKKFRWI